MGVLEKGLLISGSAVHENNQIMILIIDYSHLIHFIKK